MDSENIVGYKEEIRLIGGVRQRLLVRAVYTIYPAQALGLVPGQSLPVTFQTEAETDFLLEGFTYMADIAAGAQTDSTRVIPLVRAQITENNVNLFQAQVDISSFAGIGELPFALSEPKRYKEKTAVTVTFTNYSAATTYNLTLYFHGQKSQVIQSLGTV